MDDHKINGEEQSTGEKINEAIGAVEQETGHAIDKVADDSEVAEKLQTDGLERQIEDGSVDEAAEAVADQIAHDAKDKLS